MRSKFKWIFTLLLAVSMQFSFAQEKTVTGVVSDASGTLPGANVVVQGTTRGTQTDIDGRYSIQASQGDVLVFSFVGMADVRVTVGISNVINATLAEGGIMLGEVVVVGALGITRKADAVTSAQQVVGSRELTQAVNPNALQSLTGKVSGLQINTTNNGVNQTTRIVLRGSRSLTGNNEALVVIDNVISTATVLSQMPPEIIESTNIIKGAQGAALYGADGSNGVIIVTTKRGTRSGKINISVNSSIDFEEVAYVPQRQTRYGQGWNGEHISYENGAWGPEFDGSIRPVGLAQADGSYIMAPYSPIKDNIKQFFQTGTLAQNGVAFSGGTLDDGYVFFSANKQNTQFVVDRDALDRSSFIFKGGKKLNKWTVEGNVTYTTQKTETTSSNLFTELLQTATNVPVRQFSTPLNQHHWTSYYMSPYWQRDNIRNLNRRNFFNGIATINYEVNKNINVNYNANAQLTSQNALSYTNAYTDNLQVGGGNHTTISQMSQFNATTRYIYADLLVNFDYDLTENLNLRANIGNNIQDNLFAVNGVGGENLTIPGLYTIDNVTSPNVTTAGNNNNSRWRKYSYFAQLDLGYRDYLFLNVTGRNDWTSRLDESNNSYFYPSAGISFVPTKAFENLQGDILNYLKIAANITKVGNNNVGVYSINNLYAQAGGFPYGDLNSYVQATNVTNRFIEPEFYTTKELTVNLGMFNDRLTLDGSVYRTDNTGLNSNVSASAASGLATANINVGQTRTTGFEIDLGFTPIKMQNGLRWENRISYSSFKTDVLKVSDQATEIALVDFPGSGVGIFAQEGQEYPLIKGIAYLRDDEGRVIINQTTGNPEKSSSYEILGKVTPDYILGYNTSIEYKGFRLAAVMDYRTGHQFWAGTKDWMAWSGHLVESAETGRSGFIFPNSSIETSPGSGVYEQNTSIVTGGTTYTSYLNYFSNEYRSVTENFVLDATAFKVRELSLSYSFSREYLDALKLTSLRLGVNARNPFIVLPKENRKYADPEFSRSSGNDQGLSVTGQYPATRTIGFSVNMSF